MSAGIDTLFSLFLFAALLLLVRSALPEGPDSGGTDPGLDDSAAVERQDQHAGAEALPPGSPDR